MLIIPVGETAVAPIQATLLRFQSVPVKEIPSPSTSAGRIMATKIPFVPYLRKMGK
ncbi:hypothetical protein LINPERPRIM_LOCUS30235 [Linum perenne]